MQIKDAKDEIKRADHLIYVSLKYTRTCDIIQNIFKRLVAAYDFAILASLEKSKDQGKIEFIPESKMLRAESLYRLKRNFKEQLNLYFFMKKIIVSDFGRREEYRKHVTMLSHITEDEVVEIDVPQVMEYFEKTKIFINDVEEYIG